MRKSAIPLTICALMAVFLTAVTVFLCVGGGEVSRAERALEDGIVFFDGWKDGGGEDCNISRLDLAGGGEVFNTLPEFSEGSALCFRAAHIYYEILVDGETVYTQKLPEDNGFYTNSDGAVWAWVPLKTEYCGKIISIKYDLCYPSGNAGISVMKICRAEGFILDNMQKNLPAAATAFVYMILAMILIIADIPINFGKTKNHEMLYLGLVSLAIGIYVFCESQYVQMFTGNEKIMHMLSCISLIMIPIPTILYSSEAFGFSNKKLANIFSCCVGAVFALVVILNYFDIADYHDSLLIIHGVNIVSLLPMFISMIRHYTDKKRGEKRQKYSALQIIGLSALASAAVIDVLRFYISRSPDRAAFLRVGILIFIICFGISSISKMISAVKSGAKAEIIRTLAYTDGLTGLGNRTAFNEKMDEIRESGSAAGVVMLDVNNLKKVNDGQGHEMGDLLLKKSSEFISSAFDGALCYRTGGDEFVVIIEKGDLDKSYLSGAERLLSLCRKHNSLSDRDFEINIAIGFCCSSGDISIDNACKEADALMYKNKRIMKSAAGEQPAR